MSHVAPKTSAAPLKDAAPASPHELKRLAFVKDTTSTAYNASEALYKRLKSYSPALLTSRLDYAESLASPLVTRITSLGQQALEMADARVDAAVITADKSLTYGLKSAQGLKEAPVKQLNEYFSLIAKMGDYVKERSSGAVASASSTLHSAVQKARETADPDVAVALAWDAWTKFSSFPPVAKLLETADPAIKTGMTTFYTLHDNLVSTQLYAALFNRSLSTLHFASTTTPYKLGATYLYPIVRPVADPALTTVTQSKVVNQVVDFWRPAAAPVAVAAH